MGRELQQGSLSQHRAGALLGNHVLTGKHFLPRQRPFLARCALQTRAEGQALSLHIAETTISFPFDPVEAQGVNSAITSLLQTFAAKQAAERPKRWQAMEYRYKGSPEDGKLAFLEMFCNPNAYSSAFDAKVLISLKTEDGVAVTTEGRLSAIKNDIDTFLEQHAS